MNDVIAAARRVVGQDVRDALVATPLRRLLVNLQWPLVFGAAFVFGAHTPGWVWPVVVAAQLAVTLWIGNRLADHDALLSEYIGEVEREFAERGDAELDG